jgi:hypothetical protein
MGPLQKFVIVGEEGGHRMITGTPEQTTIGAANHLKAQNRRGYLAVMEGDGRNGTTIKMIAALNDPTVSFEEVQMRFAERLKTGGASNFMFRGVGGSRKGAV